VPAGRGPSEEQPCQQGEHDPLGDLGADAPGLEGGIALGRHEEVEDDQEHLHPETADEHPPSVGAHEQHGHRDEEERGDDGRDGGFVSLSLMTVMTLAAISTYTAADAVAIAAARYRMSLGFEGAFTALLSAPT
jgi:hypothetical protein